MKHLSILVLAFLSLGSSIALAQYQHSAMPAQASTSAVQANPMQECHKSHAEGLTALDRAAASLAQTQKLSDAGEIKATIESAQQQIAEAKHLLSTCPMRDMSGTAQSQHQQNTMKCMSEETQTQPD